jgi:two-component system sensor histidine kinase/response regulator
MRLHVAACDAVRSGGSADLHRRPKACIALKEMLASLFQSDWFSIEVATESVKRIFAAFPMLFLEIWGRLAFVFGTILAVCAFGGFTFRPNGRWGLGRERVFWDSKALVSIVLTITLILGFGWLGSFIVLVPNAQTLESLKDAMMFVCILLFGYPGLIGALIADILSNLIEGTPPHVAFSWVAANPGSVALYWIAYQFFGKEPDFRKARTWALYALFVLIFMSCYSAMWGYACGPMSGAFPPELSYYEISPATFSTMIPTWIIAPFLMLGALPLARRFGFFWAEIPGRAKERLLRSDQWIWLSGQGSPTARATGEDRRLPIRLLVAVPFIALVLLMVGLVAFLSLRSGERSATSLAERLHQEISKNIGMQVEDALADNSLSPEARIDALNELLRGLSIAKNGRAFIVDANGKIVALSVAAGAKSHPVVDKALETLRREPGGILGITGQRSFRFTIVTIEPFGRETWFAQAAPLKGADSDWRVITALPESDFLKPLQEGNSRAAIVFTIALLISLLIAAFLSELLTKPIRRVASSAHAIAQGDLAQRVAGSRLEELESLASSFNYMAGQIQDSFARTRASEEKLRALLDVSPLPISWMNSRGEIEFWNRRALELFGYAPEEISTEKQWFQQAYPDPEDRRRAMERWSEVSSSNEVHRVEEEITCKDGRVITTEIIGTRCGDLSLVIFNDVTERNAAEEELRQHRDHLEELVAARTAELEEARIRAEAANKAKSIFLANMSHEIRTPMNGVLGMAELLSRTPLEPGQREQLAMLKDSGEDLLTVINDILDFSKIEAGRMELEMIGFSLHDMFGRTLQALAPQAAAKRLEIELDIPDDLPDLRLGDPNRLRQVLTNLVGNAIKFTERGWVRVVVSQGLDPVGLRVEVIDTGEGISPEARVKLFRPFSQADTSTTRKHGGTGLGLVISARIIEQMGGRIGVTSEPGRGSTFWFELSLPPAALEQVTGLDDRMPALRLLDGKRVLLVDDNAVNRAVAGALMRRWGMKVEEVADGPTALVKVRTAARADDCGYDLAVLDGAMPGMDGWQLATAIREIPGCAEVPMVMASSSGLESTHSAGENSLFRRFLLKPLRPAQLAGALAEALTGWQSGQAAPIPKATCGVRVLLVEDTKVNQMVARAMLEKGGHQVTLAENGVEALAQLEQPGLFDIVLMDCQMPEMDGFEATRQLRRREQERGWQRYRVVAMTANAMESDKEACLEAGMDEYLAKPVRMDQLLQIVKGT